MGADRGILVQTDAELQPLAVAKLLKAIVDKEQPELVILGKQAIDDDCNQTGQMLAALLGWPQATFASKLDDRRRQAHGDARGRWRARDGRAQAAGGRHHRPAAQRAALCLAAQHHEGARRSRSSTLKPEALGVDAAPRLTTLKVDEPPKRQGGVKVASVAELVDKLMNEAKVI